jgi:hypothetical protein
MSQELIKKIDARIEANKSTPIRGISTLAVHALVQENNNLLRELRAALTPEQGEAKPKVPTPNVGGHFYPGCQGQGFEFFTSDCAYGCGCTMGRSSSSGPIDVDAFGECPKSPFKAVSDD